MILHRLGGASLALAVAVLAAAAAEAGEASPDVLANTCFSCHGPDGNSAGAMPSIAGKKQDYIIRTLTQFRDGQRQGTVMTRIAKGFTDSEIEKLAGYFGK